ncbi:MAG TPA: hypothetical protein VN843_17230 [Anaerolineales bacterium]|nr:hypothetical protein [Anaerolineales bacterium]
MKSVIRIVKRGRVDASPDSHPEDKEETKAPSERELANTIKGWITDREQRRRMIERSNSDMLTKFAQ